MTVRLRSLALALLVTVAASGCSTTPQGNGARFAGPADIVRFSGITRKNAGLHDYLAVASSRDDSLVFLDPSDDLPVRSPGAVLPLSIQTEPRPARLAAAGLGDGATGGADLLVVVSAGALDLQVVETWTATNRVSAASSVSLGPAVGEGSILSVAAFTPPSATPTAPRARVLVGLTGQRLAVVDFTRDAATGGVVPGAPVVKAIGFDPLAIAIEPGGSRAFFATLDPLSASGATVFGVAFLDASADPSVPWVATVVDALAPTRALALARVNERLVDPTNPAAQDTFDPVARLRIYAILDASGPSGCGPGRPIACGVAMLDENGLLPDPAGELPYRAPLPVPGIASAIAIGLPPASGNGRIQGDVLNPTLPLLNERATGSTSDKNTSAVAAVTSTNGLVYLYDLSRYSPMNAGLSASVNGITAATQQPPDVGVVGSPSFGKPVLLGLWSDFPLPPSDGSAPAVLVTPASMPAHVQITPGFTSADTWLITWQGELPGLSTRRGVVGRLVSGELFVAIQTNAGTVSQPVWISGATLGDPALGLRDGDLAVVTLDDPALCPGADPAQPDVELTLTAGALLPADPARFPGGAARAGPGSCLDATLGPGQLATATITLRTSGFVLTSEQAGYLGRPIANQPFALRYTAEAGLAGEALAVDRKVRRSFYPLDAPCTSGGAPPAPGCYTQFPWVADPFAPGPTIAFRLGLVRLDLPATAPPPDPSDPAILRLIPRDSRIVIRTGVVLPQTAYRPLAGGVLPIGLIAYDPTKLPGHANDPVRFYAAFRDDQVLELTPSVLGGNPKFIR